VQRLRETAQQRLEALRIFVLPIAQSAIAAGLAWLVAHDAIGHKNAFFAPIAALIALGVATVNRMRRVVELTLGVALGILVADLLVSRIGSGVWQIALVVALAMAAAVLLGGGPLFISQAASSSVLVVTLIHGHNASRFVDALVGGAVGLLVLVVAPVNPLRRAQQEAAPAFAELSATLREVADALEAHDAEAARAALARAREIEPHVARWRAALDVGIETARLSPPYWRARTELERQLEASRYIDFVARNARVLARGAVRAVELDPDFPPELPAAVRQLALAVERTGAALASGSSGEDAIASAIGAVELATRAADRDSSLPVVHLVAQIRSAATDLLRTVGAEHRTAVEHVRRATQRE
jgi:uncharacterized membrane protein YgaE (UPF0421/DUF939 family)